MKKISFILVLVLVLSSTHSKLCFGNFRSNYFVKTNIQASCCESIYEKSQFDSLTLEQLGQEFQRLKALNCQDCKNWGSDLATIMRILEKKLSGKSRKQVKRIMGKPDESGINYLFYYWRGKHDYLIFDFSEGKGAVIEWYYAFE